MICKTCGASYTPRHPTQKYCSDLCTPYKNWAMAWDLWKSMHKRCKDPKTNGYKNYGGRGIQVCKEWEDYPTFLQDMGYRPSKNHQLDRINSNENYSKSNCRWVTVKENIRNKESCQPIEFNGESLYLTDWADKLGISISTLTARISNWGLEKALTTPKGPTGPKRK